MGLVQQQLWDTEDFNSTEWYFDDLKEKQY